MSAAASPGPNNILLLAVLGIGAYYLMTRRAVAQPVYTTGQRPTTTAQERVGLLSAGIGAVGNLVRGFTGGSAGAVPLLGTYDGRSQTQWDVTPQGPGGPTYNNPSAYVAGGNDGLALNPANASPWDYTSEPWY
jgi:hypothetical protein